MLDERSQSGEDSLEGIANICGLFCDIEGNLHEISNSLSFGWEPRRVIRGD